MVIKIVIFVSLCLLVFFLPLILEVRAQCVNPTPKMNNEDKRFAQIEKEKTRDMYECIKQVIPPLPFR